MKKIILILSVFTLQGVFANSQKSIEVKNKIDSEIVNNEKFKVKITSIYGGIEGLMAFLAQASDCTKVQQNVINTYSGDPRFTQEQVNNMALGAFAGCMKATAID